MRQKVPCLLRVRVKCNCCICNCKGLAADGRGPNRRACPLDRLASSPLCGSTCAPPVDPPPRFRHFNSPVGQLWSKQTLGPPPCDQRGVAAMIEARREGVLHGQLSARENAQGPRCARDEGRKCIQVRRSAPLEAPRSRAGCAGAHARGEPKRQYLTMWHNMRECASLAEGVRGVKARQQKKARSL